MRLGFQQVKSGAVTVYWRFKTICPLIMKLSHMNKIFSSEAVALCRIESGQPGGTALITHLGRGNREEFNCKNLSSIEYLCKGIECKPVYREHGKITIHCSCLPPAILPGLYSMDRAPVFFDSRGLMLPFLRRRWTLSFTVTTNFRPNSSGRRTYLWVGGFSGSSFNSPGYFKLMCIPMKFLEVAGISKWPEQTTCRWIQ